MSAHSEIMAEEFRTKTEPHQQQLHDISNMKFNVALMFCFVSFRFQLYPTKDRFFSAHCLSLCLSLLIESSRFFSLAFSLCSVLLLLFK